jgi:hypothetical protein
MFQIAAEGENPAGMGEICTRVTTTWSSNMKVTGEKTKANNNAEVKMVKNIYIYNDSGNASTKNKDTKKGVSVENAGGRIGV